ncbi:hypothetical protein KY092_19880 [Natronomonas gomsonensis]|uniref:hypothetical protein n=1 Tax=Natronomonas gomsonensis TaxID=1046043 RepID=UPI0020CA5620|nr:hypothetical protein [Natronomonas gomsonensis]MCY4732799.1 hypothetical protein [Natronomonas gomsonensis]
MDRPGVHRQTPPFTAGVGDTHLPLLQEAGVIEYDPQRETIRYHATDIVEELLK